MKVEIATFPMEFRVVVRHSSAARSATENIICLVESDLGEVGVGEGCPRSYVTGETVTSARAFLCEHGRTVAEAAEIGGVMGLSRWVADHRDIIDRNPAAFASIEIALLDLLGRQHSTSVEGLLGLPQLSGSFQYSAVIGDSPRLVYSVLLHRYLRRGFRDLKVKLSGDLARDRAKVRRLGQRSDVRVRFDANNHWRSPGECIDYLRRLDFNPFAIEEPLAVGDLDGFAEVADASGARIILDESALRANQFTDLPGNHEIWIVNCRVSKMGGVLRSVETVQAARAAGLGIVVGAQVGETSILSRAALPIASACGDALIAQEGAFGTHLLKQDLTHPVVMFDRTGEVAVPAQVNPSAPGLGLVVRRDGLTDRETIR